LPQTTWELASNPVPRLQAVLTSPSVVMPATSRVLWEMLLAIVLSWAQGLSTSHVQPQTTPSTPTPRALRSVSSVELTMLVEIWAQSLSARWQRVSRLVLLILAVYVPHSLMIYWQLTTVGGCLTLRYGLLYEADARCSYLGRDDPRREACLRASTFQLLAN